MTAILEEIRRLDAAKQRGDLTEGEYNSAKAKIVSAVEEADVAPSAIAPPRPSFRVFDIVLLCAIATFACVGLATILFGDLTLALTLAVTILAAFTIHAFRTLDD